MMVEVSNARERAGDQDQDRREIDRLERELDDALSRLVDAEDELDRLRLERDTARRIAVACENDERRQQAESDEAIRLLLERDEERISEIGALTVRNQELERLLASRQAG